MVELQLKWGNQVGLTEKEIFEQRPEGAAAAVILQSILEDPEDRAELPLVNKDT